MKFFVIIFVILSFNYESALSHTPQENAKHLKNIGQADPGDFWSGHACEVPNYPATNIVSDKDSFENAVQNASPGEIIYLEAGKTFSLGQNNCMEIYDVNGAEGNPVIVTTDPNNPAIIADGECGLAIINSSYLEISNIKIERTTHWGMLLGGGHETKNRPATGAHNVIAKNVEISQIGQEGLIIDWDSSNIEFSCGNIHHTGDLSINPADKKRLFGEAVYIGRGRGKHDHSHHIKIANNHIHHIPGEAVDVKHGTTDIEILNNYIHDIEVHSQAAITVGIANEDYPNGNIAIIGNRIHDITKRDFDGGAIVVGHGDTLIMNNIIWNIPDYPAIYTQKDAFGQSSPNKVYIYNNTVFNTPHGPLGFNLGSDRKGRPGEVVAINNLWEADIDGNQRATVADFLDPSGLADDDEGPGSGFRLSPVGASKISPKKLADFDILSIPRSDNNSFGAFQQQTLSSSEENSTGENEYIFSHSATNISASFACLENQTDVVNITGFHDKKYKPDARKDRVFDARDAEFLIKNDTHGMIYVKGDESESNMCWAGGYSYSDKAWDASWNKHKDLDGLTRNSSTIDNASTLMMVTGMHFFNVHDGPRGSNGSDWVVQHVWGEYIRDDALENDHMHSGTVYDSLFDGTYTGLSTRPGRGSEDSDNGSGYVVVLDKVLLRSQAMPWPFKWESKGENIGKDGQPWNGDGIPYGHGKWFKYYDEDNRNGDRDTKGVHYELKNSVFAASHKHVGSDRFNFPAVTLIDKCENVTIAWLGDSSFEGDQSIYDAMQAFPGCIKILEGDVAQEFWKLKVVDWHERHPDVGTSRKPTNPGEVQFPQQF